MGHRSSPARGTYSPIVVAVAALALVTASLAGLAAAQMSAAESAPPFLVLPLAGSYDAAARSKMGEDRAAAMRLTQQALRTKPTDTEAWIRLAELETQGGRLNSKGVEALTRAYLVAPYHPGLLARRTAFAYDHWSELPPDLQRQVQAEVEASWRIWALRQRLFTAAQATSDPAGRVQLALRLFTLRLADLSERSARKAAERAAAAKPQP
jgi:hypothetical protein